MPIILNDFAMGIVLRGLILSKREAEALGDTLRAAECSRLIREIVDQHDILTGLEMEVRP